MAWNLTHMLFFPVHHHSGMENTIIPFTPRAPARERAGARKKTLIDTIIMYYYRVKMSKIIVNSNCFDVNPDGLAIEIYRARTRARTRARIRWPLQNPYPQNQRLEKISSAIAISSNSLKKIKRKGIL